MASKKLVSQAMRPDSRCRIVGHISAGKVLGLAGLLLTVLISAGCVPSERRPRPLDRPIADAARPILKMAPDAVWSDCYDRLVELAPASIAYLAEHPVMRRPAAPDDLRVMLHTSLLRLLAHPATRPRLSANCLETTLDVLHFDLKVDGRRIGTPLLAERRIPAAWHDLYPADFDHELAGRIDAEADRLAMRRWWHTYRDRPCLLATGLRLRPRADTLWRLLSRRYADRWVYQPEPRAIRCAGPPLERALIKVVTCDYNLVRAACVWLGSAGGPETRERLIELVGSPSPIVAHNALLALRYVPDQRIRDVLERHENRMEGRPRGRPIERNASPTGNGVPRMKWLNFAVGSLLLVAAAVFTAVKFGSFEVQQLQQEVERLEHERRRLIDYAQRLGASRRVAQVDVVRQRQSSAGHTVSTLLWQEIGPDGTLGKPIAVEAVGAQVYFEALVIKFAHRHVEEGDPERGTSLAMFRRIFGDQQAPESVEDIDRSARPLVNAASGSSSLHDELWARFWEMVDDPKLAARYGVRVVQCEAPAVRLQLDQVWEITIDAAGGLNVKKIGTRPGAGHASVGEGQQASP